MNTDPKPVHEPPVTDAAETADEVDDDASGIGGGSTPGTSSEGDLSS